MSNNESKLTVSTTQERLTLGADVIKLDDQSRETYHTDDFKEFVKFAKANASEGSLVIYNDEQATMVGPLFKDARNNGPKAVVVMKTHPRLEEILKINGKDLSLQAVETLLRKLKKNLVPDGLLLLDRVCDFKVAKVQKIERKKERNGNYRFLATRESAGTDDFTPPETVKFDVPLFEGMEEKVSVVMDFRFEYTDRADGVTLSFTFENLNIEEELLEARKMVLGDALSSTGITALWGSHQILLGTNNWSFQRNPADI